MKPNATNFRRLLRPALLLGAALGFVFGPLPGASAQTGPQQDSPAVPTPYQSPVFHGGGAEDPRQGAVTATPLSPLPLYEGRLQGTPTTVVNVAGIPTPVQVPSFLLGAYLPSLAPGNGNLTTGGYYPDHFADGGFYQWVAPFSYVSQSAQQVLVDDNDPNNFVPTGNFTQTITGTTAAGLATNQEYRRLDAGNSGTATWTLTVPVTVPNGANPAAPNVGGNFSVYFHIPDNVPDLTQTPAVSEVRSTTVRYTITSTGANATTTTATVSQTEANSLQFLAGPFTLAPGNSVQVTLSSSNNSSSAVLIADSMTLQPTIGDVQSTPTAVNYTAFPADFQNFKYWGIYVPPGVVTVTSTPPPPNGFAGTTAISQNAVPDNTNGLTGTGQGGNGTPLYHYGNPAKNFDENGALSPARRIRQVVYFGRSEPTAVSRVPSDSPVPTGNGVSDASATNGSYSIYGAAKVPVGTIGNPAASWSVVAPASGNYFVSVHIPGNVVNAGRTAAPDVRIGDASYVVSYTTGGTLIQRMATLSQTTGGDYTLSTGAVPLLRNQTATITLYSGTQSTVTNPSVVADSVTLTTGSQVGAIYCVDGFNGEVIWRFETPSSTRGPSAAVFSAPAIKHIHVLTGFTTDPNSGAVTPNYADKLVVIVGDNSGLVYCLDAVGNGDGTSNANVIDTTTGQPIYLPQPLYGSTPPIQVDAANYVPHVGTTQAYWIYRPDANLPKKLLQAAGVAEEAPLGLPAGLVRRTPAPTGGIAGAALHLYDRDLPIPGAFNNASPNVFVDPAVPDVTMNNAVVYLPNSNGVLYAIDALGVAVTTDPATGNETSGDRFNNSIDLTTSEGDVPTPTTRWWFTLRGVAGASGTGDSAAAFTSAPALYVAPVPVPANPVTGAAATTAYLPSVYVGSSSEEGDSSNVGRVYALDGLAGPSGNGGKTPASLTAPGTPNYNLTQRPQTALADTMHWSFPDAYGTDAYGTGQSRDPRKANNLGGPRPALGDVTGSPVVFTNLNRTAGGTVGENAPTRQTRIYFAANSGLEIAPGSTDTVAAARPDDTATGRVWAVNLDGSVGTTTSTLPVAGNSTNTWAYPLANDPNDARFDSVQEPQLPIGSFLTATPAIGFVQFPQFINNGDGTPYAPADVLRGSLKSAFVPMLYVATRGVDDTALYALDIDGDGTQGPANVNGVTTGKLIYRQPSPDGSIFQSSPALVANSSTVGGNGGAVYAVTGNTLYDFSATPITNPFPTQGYPLIRQNAAFTGFGPISSPTIAAADVSDLTATALFNGLYGGANVTDWIYIGDSASGFCRGITPQDANDGGIPGELGFIVPPSVNGAGQVDLTSLLQTYLVNNANAGSVSAADGLAVGATAPLPVYEWGQNVYIRIKNIVPPGGVVVYDTTTVPSNGNPVAAYRNGSAITFTLSDPSPGGTPDSGTIPNVLLTPPANASTPLANGIYRRTDTDTVTNIKDPSAPKTGYIGAFTYHISDGSDRLNTPGSQRKIMSATQTVEYGTYDGANFTVTDANHKLVAEVTNGNLVTKPVGGQNTLAQIAPVDQPTFGILNPIGVQGGGVPLPLTTTYNQAFNIGDTLGPFRGVASPMPANPSFNDLEALANGNRIPLSAPPSTSGSGTNPTVRQATDLSTTPTSNIKVVVTSTPLIPHNGSGDNTDPTSITTVPHTTDIPPDPPTTGTAPPNNTTGLGTQTNFGTVGLPYALDFFDRSALGVAGQTLNVRMSATPGGGAGGGLAWVDNTVLTSQGNITGHDSVVNYLPWETAPLGVRAGPNTSADYPNISAGNVTATLYGLAGSADLGAGQATPTPATPGTGTDTVLSRIVYGSPVQVHIRVPIHQPANQQVYVDTATGGTGYNAAGEMTPYGLNISQRAYPMGYYSTRRVYVPNSNGLYRRGAAYRNIRIYTGVPVDMSTSIDNPTTDVGRVPSALGVQTDSFSPLGLFAPVNPNYNSFFQPVTVHNDGNVNLLNVHLDQKEYYNGAAHTLRLNSDSLDPLSYILGYDDTGLTGPRANLPGGITQQSYLLRSSLDTDLVDAYGRNPAIVSDANLDVRYPGATFHKALPGSDNPTTLTVPDSPEDTSTGYSLPASPNNRPLLNANGVPQVAAPPYVSLAVPFGTPVGTYSQTVRIFEGLDTQGYNTYNGNGSGYNPLYPPQYGGAPGGLGTPNYTSAAIPRDVYQYGLQPVSTTGTIVKGSVIEDRMTDGLTFGALPQVDPAATPGAVSVPDFGPAAFRDPQSGRLSVYWTSGAGPSRTVPAAPATPSYDIFGYNVNYNTPAFVAANGGQTWWSPIPGAGATPGAIFNDPATHSGLTIAQNGNSVYAFDVAVTNAPLYANKLYAYPVTANTGVIGNGILLTQDDSQVKYGIKGLLTGSTNTPEFAFWTASTRGRTAIYYTANFTGTPTPATTFVLPVPAGLTAVADPSPVLMPAGNNQSQVEVTFSGTAPDGSVDLYNCRYLIDSSNTGKLNLTSFVAVREIMAPVGGGYQARDAAWDRTGQLNLFAIDTTKAPTAAGYETPLLYKTVGGVLTPQFNRAIVDKASGQLVLTGLPVPNGTNKMTAYIDGAAGRVRFVPALPPTMRVEGLFVPQARRITGAGSDRRADTGPVTFLDHTIKPNDSPNLPPVAADRRWYLWRKSAAGQAAPATLFFKTQRLTAYLPSAVETRTILPATTAPPITITVNGAAYSGPYDLYNAPAGQNPSARLYFPIDSGAEGQAYQVTYTPYGSTSTVTVSDVVQWQDERLTSDISAPPIDTLQGLQAAEGYAVPIDQPVNENNVAAFLDSYAGQDSTGAFQSHKVWLFWNSTRNGTADLYMETIDPRFGP